MNNKQLAFLGFALFSTPLAANALQYGDFTYSTAGGGVTITDYTGSSTNVDIPETIAGTPVTSIGDWSFASCTGMISVTIPVHVTGIGTAAFQECAGLASVTILGAVTDIGDFAFNSCSALTSFTIPDSVASIGNLAFNSCNSLLSLTVADANPSYSSTNGVLFNKELTTLIQYPGGKAGDYTIPGSVVSIWDNAFSFCYGLTRVAFPGSTSSIGSQAFKSCTNLMSFTVEESSESFSGAGGVIFDKGLTQLIQYPCGKAGSYTIPGSVTSIGDLAFYGCSGLTGVSIPASVTIIGNNAFAFCLGLTSVTIPEGVYWIKDYAFSFCSNLSSVFFKGYLPYIGMDVFYGCDNVTIYYQFGDASYWLGAFPDFPPVVLWNPAVEAGSASFGVHGNQFGFNIIGTAGIPVVVEASTNLTSGLWVPLQTGVLAGGSLSFSDPAWTNYPSRFYRINMP